MAGRNKLSDGNNLQVAEKMLFNVTRIFRLIGLKYWLDAGTLLGIVREDRLLPWDNDMDVAVLDSDKPKLVLLIFLLMLRGYRLTLQNHQSDLGPFKKGQLRIIKVRRFTRQLKKGPVVLDIFVKREVGQDCMWAEGMEFRVLKSTPKRCTATLTQINFKDAGYLIPEFSQEYLTIRYGDWKVPRPDWDFLNDDLSILDRDLAPSD